MNRWETNFDKHGIHQQLRVLGSTVAGEVKKADETEVSERLRLKKVVAACQKVLAKLDPELVPFDQLKALSNQLAQEIVPKAEEYRRTGNLQPLQQANNLLTNELSKFALFKAIAGKVDVTPSPDSLRNEFVEVVGAISEEQKKADEWLKRFSAEIAEFSDRLKELRSQTELRREQIDAQISEWQKQFSEAQETRSQVFEAWRNDRDERIKQQIDRTINEYETQLSAGRDRIIGELGQIIEDATEKHDTILKLHELTAEDSVAGGYVSNAKNEKKAADFWRWVSVGFIFATVLWLAISFWSGQDSVSWQSILKSLPLSGVLLFGAAYAAQQSARHRNVEVKNRRFALEMAAIDPYLQSLNRDDQQELKKELTKKFFGQQETEDKSSIIDEHVSARILESIGKNIIRPLADAVKSGK